MKDAELKLALQLAAIGNSSSLYKRGVRVCTGTGLGSALSTCIQVGITSIFQAHAHHLSYLPQNDGWYLIWMGSDQEKTFGPIISDLISKHLVPQNRVTLWDSKARGTRPDSVQLVKDVVRVWGACFNLGLMNDSFILLKVRKS